MSQEFVRTHTSGPLGVITVDRQSHRNALNTVVIQELRDAMDNLVNQDGIAVIAFTGAGEKAFVAGADVNELAQRTAADGLQATLQHLYDDVESCPKPTIAGVKGFALGGGCELAMACDIRIAAENARFGLPETALGILPGAGGTQRLPRLVGTGRALEMILTGRIIDANEAKNIGLVTHVVSAESLMDEVLSTAEQLGKKGPLALRLARTVVRNGAENDQRTGMLLEQLAQSVLYTTADKNEGTEAFIEKRAPAFQGS